MGAARSRCAASGAPCFRHGVPGVPQGVPPEMVKGYQPPAEAPPPVIEAKQPKAKQKQPQKKAAAAPRKQPRQQVAAGAGTTSRCSRRRPRAARRTQPVQGQGGFQTMPGAQPTWPADAQPAPRR